MLFRSQLLFDTQISRESRRVDSTVIRVLYLGFTMSILWTVCQMSSRDPGLAFLRAMTVVHSPMAIVLAVRLSGDIAGNRTSGLVGLLALAGVTSREAVGSHLLLGAVTFLSVWLIRIPILCLAFHLGGVAWLQVLCVEVLLLGLFGMTYSAGLILAHYSTDRSTSRMIFLFPAIVEMLLWVPWLVVSVIQYVWSWSPPFAITELLDVLGYFRFTSALYYSLQSRAPSLLTLCPLLLQAGISLWSLWAWTRVYFTRLDEADQFVTSGPSVDLAPSRTVDSSAASRPSRPVWDDALAWQAFHVHSDGQRNLTTRSIAIGGVLLVCIVLAVQPDPSYGSMAVVVLTISTLSLMFIGRGKVSDCLQREIKQQTLPSLLLTPHRSLDLIDGWSRGAKKLAKPDFVLHMICLAVLLVVSPNDAAPIFVAVAMLLMASEPFFVLSPLVPYSVRGIATGLGVIIAVICAGTLAVLGSVAIHPWAGPIVFALLIWCWNRYCRYKITEWFASKQDEVV